MRTLTPSQAHDAIRAAAPRRAGRIACGAAFLAACAALLSPAANAEKGDRNQPMSITSSGSNPDTVDLKKHNAVFTGNVVITQGTLEIHADRVEVSEDPDGNQLGYAYGTPGKPATFRQKRDGEDQFSEGDAQRIEYDSAANRVRFIGAAHLRMLQGTTVTDRADAALITYDTATDTVALNGGAGTSAAAQPASAGRTTVIFTPRAASAPKVVPPLELPKPASGSSK